MVSARAIARPAMRGAGRSVRHRFVRAYALQFALSVSHVHVQLLGHLCIVATVCSAFYASFA